MKWASPRRLTKRAKNARPTPLDIPEILELILSFLRLHDRLLARRVCKLWYRVSRKSVKITLETQIPILQMDRYTFIRQIDSLIHTISPTQDVSTSARYTAHFFKAVKAGTLDRLQELVIQGPTKDYELWGPILLYLPALSAVELDNMRYPALAIQMFLNGCPQLTRITARFQGEQQSSNASPERMGAGSSPRGPYQLKTLVLDRITIGLSWIESTINNSPGLTKLRLLQIVTDNPYDEEQGRSSEDPCFISRVHKSCPQLRVFQWCLTNFVQSQINLTFTDHDEKSKQENAFSALGRFTRIRDLGVPDSLLSPTLWRTISALPNRLTSLSIFRFPTFLYQESGNINGIKSISTSKLLHRYLCSSPQLLHLHAPNFMFDDRLLTSDSNEDCSEDENSIWVCRNLMTLSLGFGNWLDSHLPPDDPETTIQDVIRTLYSITVSSRIVFGYLAQVCPRLTQLWITRRWLDCSLDGGMVLLTNMERLERLEIATGSQVRVHFWDFIWLYTSPSKLVKLTNHLSSNESKVQRILRYRYEWLGCTDCADVDNDLLDKLGLPQHYCEASRQQTQRQGSEFATELAYKFNRTRSSSNNSFISSSSSSIKELVLAKASSKTHALTKSSTKRVKEDRHTIPYDSWPYLKFLAFYETHDFNTIAKDLKNIMHQLRPSVTFESHTRVF
ncbi:hypothetical protein BGZ59_001132 [Podila verticillata]|nr:hypothetical protein BGZ59_001132 [Podila verticillata]KFH71325.1 hypothetical protein MVEG_01625 [Podila verticillata NRRL 6337]